MGKGIRITSPAKAAARFQTPDLPPVETRFHMKAGMGAAYFDKIYIQNQNGMLYLSFGVVEPPLSEQAIDEYGRPLLQVFCDHRLVCRPEVFMSLRSAIDDHIKKTIDESALEAMLKGDVSDENGDAGE